jgi:hypothetical protein
VHEWTVPNVRATAWDVDPRPISGQGLAGSGPARASSFPRSARAAGSVAQNVACNRLHTTEERAARWLLMTTDRVGGSRFLLTQEFLAQMLGVR